MISARPIIVVYLASEFGLLCALKVVGKQGSDFEMFELDDFLCPSALLCAGSICEHAILSIAFVRARARSMVSVLGQIFLFLPQRS